MKYLFFLSIIFFIISCENKVETFTPTIHLKDILKNEKFKKPYYELKIHHPSLAHRMEHEEYFKNFVNEVSNDDLISLSECEYPTQRCLAFKALVEKNYPKIRTILLRHKNDLDTIVVNSKCMSVTMTVKTYMLEQLGPYQNSKYRFNKIEFKKMQEDFTK